MNATKDKLEAISPILCDGGSIHHHFFGCPECHTEVGGFISTGSTDNDWTTHQDEFCKECGKRIDWTDVIWEEIYKI